jgi:hypothetical protein
MQESGCVKRWRSPRRIGVRAWKWPLLVRTRSRLLQVMCHFTSSRWPGLAVACTWMVRGRRAVPVMSQTAALPCARHEAMR